MKVTPDIVRYEFIGAQGLVAQSSNMAYRGVGGLVIGESRNTFTFQDQKQTRSVIKDVAIFDFTFSDGTVVEIDGKLLVGRSEDRLKKSVKRLW
ncbi:MAG: ribonuclease P protein subunit [Nitrososphaerota archaeon]|jgi:ribonuclease P protein subunit POP4|uniref:ribonuclease P protein component 1 n=1 Tax=Candidatus Bathycorpusculum sp. TaxID=2994959 RepID=UPI00282FAFDD|nr:ribonuclease P protein subunit [Candidatus Termitimicrobium sp.]MCL2432698.1 ribonuclease P protein subunit [Candidatus Termitimicrobium sp.]MDR0493916.1 ribonuclease P protein subunit [Nitrososphaerota archaeon]